MCPFAPTAQLISLAVTLRGSGYAFTCVTPATHRLVNARPGSAMARSVPDVFGWNRPFLPGVLPPALLAAAEAAGALRAQAAGLVSRVRAATLDRLLLLHSAYPTQAADAVFLGPDTYRFAQAIEGYLAGHAEGVRRAVDVGCGTGAGGLLVARACPEAEVLLTDINPAALAAARVNASVNQAHNVTFQVADLFEGVSGMFDLILANPPYLLDARRRTYRHGGGALGEGLSLRIVEGALARLAEGGSLVLYTGSAIVEGQDRLLAAVTPLLAAAACRWRYREVDPDVFGEELGNAALAGAERIAAVVLEVTRQ